MVNIFLFFAICSLSCVRSDISTKNIETIFKLESFTSFFECQTASVFFNNAQKLHIPLPDIPARPITEQDVSFLIYSRQHIEPYKVNTYDSKKSVSSVPINRNRRTVLYVHGSDKTYTEYVSKFVNALLPKEDVILIFVDWDTYAFYNLTYTRNNTTPRLGDILAKFLHQYISSGADPKDLYVIGVSSGAQAVGIGAKQIQPRIGRILGVDPVGACYTFLPPDMRLTPDDADFVEIVHCSIGNRGEPLSFLGDVTFYMNGGIIQPGCEKQESIDEINDCSHLACGPYVYKTLYNFNRYIGVKCDTYAKYKRNECSFQDTEPMGYNTPVRARGTYYVNTESNTTLCP